MARSTLEVSTLLKMMRGYGLIFHGVVCRLAADILSKAHAKDHELLATVRGKVATILY